MEKITKFILLVLVAFIVAVAFTFTKVALTVLAVWVFVGIVMFYFFRRRRIYRRQWNIGDTLALMVFSMLGPFGIVILRSNHPEL